MAYSTLLAEVQVASEGKTVEAGSLYEALKGLKDGRKRRGHAKVDRDLTHHPLGIRR